MNNTRLSAWPIAIAAVLIGCASSPTPIASTYHAKKMTISEADATPLSLFPLLANSQWTYSAKITDSNGKVSDSKEEETSLRVNSTKKTANGTEAFVDQLNDGKVVEHEIWLVNSNGVYQSASQSLAGLAPTALIPFLPAEPTIMVPIPKHLRFSWSGTGLCPDGSPGGMKVQCKVYPAEPVDTDMGTYYAIPILGQETFLGKHKGTVVYETWLRPTIGIVRYRQEVRIGNMVESLTLRLKNYAVKQS